MDAQRALLDELMGAARNLTDEEKKCFKEVTWDSEDACSFYLARFCPHDLFVHTRSDLGPCPKIHDPKLKESFASSPRYNDYVPKFEAKLAHFCEKLIMDLDRKVRRGQERLAQDIELPPPPPISAEKTERLSVLEETIKNLLEQVESLGEAGKVDEAEALMRKVELFNTEKMAYQTQQEKLIMMTQEKKMALCEICGSFLVANDVLERSQSHITGKQHVGFGMVRDFLSEFQASKEKAIEEERLAWERKAEERRKLREKENENRGRRSVSTDKDKNRNRDHERDRRRDRYQERNTSGNRGSDLKHSNSKNGWDRNRERYRERNRSRSRSPIRHGSRRQSRSPVR